jgi:hypothetical protein
MERDSCFASKPPGEQITQSDIVLIPDVGASNVTGNRNEIHDPPARQNDEDKDALNAVLSARHLVCTSSLMKEALHIAFSLGLFAYAVLGFII